MIFILPLAKGADRATMGSLAIVIMDGADLFRFQLCLASARPLDRGSSIGQLDATGAIGNATTEYHGMGVFGGG
jgi:hypothetical protein